MTQDLTDSPLFHEAVEANLARFEASLPLDVKFRNSHRIAFRAGCELIIPLLHQMAAKENAITLEAAYREGYNDGLGDGHPLSRADSDKAWSRSESAAHLAQRYGEAEPRCSRHIFPIRDPFCEECFPEDAV